MLTSRTLQGRLYMVPDRPEVREIIVGVIAMGQRMHAVRIHGLACMSNHFHLVVTGDNTEQIAGFMKYVKGNLTREFNVLRDRSGTMWHRRYDMELSDCDERSQVQMLAYVLAHGAKEGLVEQPQMWPGVSSAAQLLDGAAPTEGIWTRRTAMTRTTAKVIAEHPERFRITERVELSPLPTLEDRDEDERRAMLRAAVEAAVRKGLDGRAADGRSGSNPARSAAEARQRARRLDWRTTMGASTKKPRGRQTAPWRRQASVEAIRAIGQWYAEASRKHRAGEACAYPPFTIPAWLRMGEAEGVRFKRLGRRARRQWRRRAKTGVRYGPETYCRARPPPPGGR